MTTPSLILLVRPTEFSHCSGLDYIIQNVFFEFQIQESESDQKTVDHSFYNKLRSTSTTTKFDFKSWKPNYSDV